MNKNPKKPTPERVPALDRLVYDALKSKGWLLPTTPQEVAQAEAALAELPLPEDLRDFGRAVSRSASPCRRRIASLALDADVAENLARAARDGAAISPAVEAIMNQDRAGAEREADERK